MSTLTAKAFRASFFLFVGVVVSTFSSPSRPVWGQQSEREEIQRQIDELKREYDKRLQELQDKLDALENGEGFRDAKLAPSRYLPGERRIVKIKDVDFIFCWVPAGSFRMGDDERGGDSSPAHMVKITKGFWMAATETSQQLWELVMGTNPSVRTGSEEWGNSYLPSELPVENVNWEDCNRFARKLNGLGVVKSGTFRLPTEAEWEYACRAGTTGDCNVEDAPLHSLAWYGRNSKIIAVGTNYTRPIGRLTPNAWGLYDMLGNVNEWTSDWFGDYSSKSQVDPVGPSDGEKRVARGGCYKHQDVYSAFRLSNYPDRSSGFTGFRILLTEDNQ